MVLEKNEDHRIKLVNIKLVYIEILNKIMRRKNKMQGYEDSEFNWLIKPIIDNKEYQKTKNISHHGITRYDHSMRVAYYSYKVTKMFHLDYQDTTTAALLHDFFIDEVKDKNIVARLREHPDCAVKNATKYFNLNSKQVDIIKTHMFPVTFTPPKYLESWIVDIVDDVAAIYEKGYTVSNELKTAMMFLFIFFINLLNVKL